MTAGSRVKHGEGDQRGREVAKWILTAGDELDITGVGRRDRLGRDIVLVGCGPAAERESRMSLDGRDQGQKLGVRGGRTKTWWSWEAVPP